MKINFLLLLPLLTACAQSSGVMKMGPDTYTVSTHAAPARGGESGAKRLSLTEANQYCDAQGKEILVTNIESGSSSHLPGGTVDITFRCLTKDDPELQRPSYEKAADIVVETR